VQLAASQLIKLYMETQLLMGSIYYPPTPEARLLDALNGISDMGPARPGRFLQLSKVTVQYPDGKEEKLAVAYINKATVQLAATLGGADAGRGLGAQKGPKSYPYVEKSPLPIQLATLSYEVTGNMYHLTYQRIWHVLEDAQTFLPVTHAKICTLANGREERIPFVAVNKGCILSLQECGG